MDLGLLDPLLELGRDVISRVWPDPVKQAEEMRKLQELHQAGNIAEMQGYIQLVLGQLEINREEAKHKSVFVAGWRPFIGWMGGSAMAYQFVLYPLLLWGWALLQVSGTIPADLEAPPVLDTGALFAIVMGMLGIGAQRSWDKSQGTQTDNISRS